MLNMFKVIQIMKKSNKINNKKFEVFLQILISFRKLKEFNIFQQKNSFHQQKRFKIRLSDLILVFCVIFSAIF
jgi:hypothetical protein